MTSPFEATAAPAPAPPAPATASVANPTTTLKTGVRQIPNLADQVAQTVLTQFKKDNLQADQLAFSLIDLRDPARPAVANFRGEDPIYPASVVKLFYLAAAQRQLQDGVLKDTPELRRAMRDMIVDSTNDATAMIVDALTNTTGGPELAPDELKAWGEKRNAVNRYFKGLGYTGINVNQKPWNEGPYGREKQYVMSSFGGRNMLTSRATAELMAHIATDDFISPDRCRQMKELLQRDPYQKTTGVTDRQATNYFGKVLRDIPGAKLWSKAGWTDVARHDVAYIELPPSATIPKGAKFVVSAFTTNHANEFEIIPAVLRGILKGYFETPTVGVNNGTSE